MDVLLGAYHSGHKHSFEETQKTADGIVVLRVHNQSHKQTARAEEVSIIDRLSVGGKKYVNKK